MHPHLWKQKCGHCTRNQGLLQFTWLCERVPDCWQWWICVWTFLHINFIMAECFPEKLRWCSVEWVCHRWNVKHCCSEDSSSSCSSHFPTRWGQRPEFLISRMFCPGHPLGWSAVPAYPFGCNPSISLLVSPLVFYLALSCQQLFSLHCFLLPEDWILLL